jgi:hypothetical protein
MHVMGMSEVQISDGIRLERNARLARVVEARSDLFGTARRGSTCASVAGNKYYFFATFLMIEIRETLNRGTFCGEPAQLCDAGARKINGLAPLF